MRRWIPVLSLIALLACGESDPLAPEANTAGREAAGSGIVLRQRPGRFLCGLPPDELGRTCRFIPEEASGP